MAFDRFARAFEGAKQGPASTGGWEDARLLSISGYQALSARFGGATFRSGLYRVHDSESGGQSPSLVEETFPRLAGRVRCFGFDWLGRQFACDFGRMRAGEPLVMMLEPGTGEALQIPATLVEFHDQLLVDDPEPALAVTFFDEWARLHRDTLPLGFHKCIGYRVPLFLGGPDTTENLDLVDIEVYWSLCGQLLQQTSDLPPGTKVGGIDIIGKGQ